MHANTESPNVLSRQCWEDERTVPGGIVAGVDGSIQSVAALNTAAGMARRNRCPLHVVMAIPSFPSYHISPASSDSGNVSRLRVSLTDGQLRDIVDELNPEETWTREVVIGQPAHVIVTIAERHGADLIIVGRRRHGRLDRLLGGETTLEVMRASSVPVLAVEEEIDKPESAVVACDFFPPSVRAARVALDLLGKSGTLYLVYVEPSAELLPQGFALLTEEGFPGSAVVRFRRLMGDLGTRSGVVIEPVILSGNSMSEILEFAERVGADLIATGSHGYSRIDRFLLGSVSTGLVRNANCSVLVTPADE